MPFAYYGAKHGLAHKYPVPNHDVVIEPFAGSAAYSIRHIQNLKQVILVEKDPAVVELWHRLFKMTVDDLDAIDSQLLLERSSDPLICASGGSVNLAAALSGKSSQITPRMRQDWHYLKRRIAKTLPHLSKIKIIHGSYEDAPDMEATYFVDPPYQVLLNYRSIKDGAGNAYRFGSNGIDYDHLSKWCMSRQGFVIVCEQQPASWLPFVPLSKLKNSQNISRMEVVWTSNSDHLLFPWT
jgi:site-specific DNA-adenine methylase